jgi:hypothetical protein
MMDLLEEWCLSVGHPNDLDVTGLSVALEQARLKYHAQAVRYLALGARDKTWPLAISGHPSSSAYPRIVYSIALEQKEQWHGALTPTLCELA